eukprot:3930979-Karenia_brevis.AAC.1
MVGRKTSVGNTILGKRWMATQVNKIAKLDMLMQRWKIFRFSIEVTKDDPWALGVTPKFIQNNIY